MSDQRKVAFYIRVSTKHQDTPEGSLKSQEQRLEEWRKYYNSVNNNDEPGKETLTFAVPKVFRDVESGASGDKRPGYKNMLLEIQNNKVDAIACTSISRLNRNLREFYDLMDLCNENKVDIISLKESFDTSTAIGRALLKFMLVFYELEREQTSERGKDNLYARFKRGLWRSGTLIGYESDLKHKGNLIPIPEEVELINKIFDVYSATGSLKKTSEILADEGYFTPRRKLTGTNKGEQKPLSDATIRRILSNKTYIGINQWKKDNKGKSDIEDPMEQYQECEGIWEAIVDVEKFELANEILKKNKQSNTNFVNTKKKVYELSGIIKCGVCHKDTYLKTISGTSKTGKTYYYYKCDSCNLKISAEEAEKIVISQISLLSEDKALIDKLIKKANSKTLSELSSFKKRLGNIDNKRKDLQNEMDDSIKHFGNIELTETLRIRMLEKDNEYKMRLKELVDEEEKLKSQIDKIQDESYSPNQIARLFTNVSKLADKMAPLLRRKLLQFSLSQCELTKDELIIHISDQVKKISLHKEKVAAEKVFGAATIMRD